ncbi:MAG: DUF4192 domain-containing protein [Nocardioides sp.]
MPPRRPRAAQSNTQIIRARMPDDLLAAVPVLLGFAPADAVVLLSVGATEGFHGRIDLPAITAEWPAVIRRLLEPALRYRVRQVVLMIYAAQPRAVHEFTCALITSFEHHGIQVVDALGTDGSHWVRMGPSPDLPSAGVPYDTRTNPITLEAMVHGRAMFPSRKALAASLRGDQAAVAATEAELTNQLPLSPGQVRAESAWLTESVDAHTAAGTQPGAEETARLLVALTHLDLRDGAWSGINREVADDSVAFWTGVLRRTPTALLPAPASLLAFAAWLAGQGALAWCALDRCAEADRDYRMAGLVARLLDGAISPSDFASASERRRG